MPVRKVNNSNHNIKTTVKHENSNFIAAEPNNINEWRDQSLNTHEAYTLCLWTGLVAQFEIVNQQRMARPDARMAAAAVSLEP